MPDDRWTTEAVITLPRRVASGYFETMGIQIVAGRAFDESDRSNAPRVVVVDQALAHRFWPGEDPIGKLVYRRNGVPGEVVGVAGPVRYEPLGVDQPGVLYVVLPQRGDKGHGLYMVVRTAPGAPPDLLSTARRVVQRVDPDQPVIDSRTMEARLHDALTVRRLSATLPQGFDVVALTLALVGLYGTVTYGVSRSLHSIAVRMALGARAHQVAAIVLRLTLLLTAAGTCLGAVIALGISRLAGSVLYGISPEDPATFLGTGAVFIVASLAAGAGPARRAVAVYPMKHFRAN